MVMGEVSRGSQATWVTVYCVEVSDNAPSPHSLVLSISVSAGEGQCLEHAKQDSI